MTTCAILHNMIIEHKKDLNLEFFFKNVDIRVKPIENPDKIQAFLETCQNIENTDTHKQLKVDLIQHALFDFFILNYFCNLDYHCIL
jgi:hypothetical protein